MYKCFISGGCSFTAGHELADFTEEFNSSLTWDFLVKSQLCPNAEMIRTAIGGLSNESICRRVISAVHDSLKKHKNNQIFVTVMWTGIGRKEFFYYDNNNEQDFVKTYLNDVLFDKGNTAYLKKYNNERQQFLSSIGILNLVKESYRRGTNISLLYYNLKEIDYLKSYLEANNINYKFTCAYDDMNATKDNLYIEELYQRLNHTETFINYKHKDHVFYFNEYTDLKEYNRGKSANHPLEKAHRDWSKLFLNSL